MNLSIHTLLLAIKAIERDIKRHEEIIQDESLSEEDSDFYGQYVLDLMKALSEIGSLYQDARESHPEFPTFEEATKTS